jgi:uncharacterized membrane protein YgcG
MVAGGWLLALLALAVGYAGHGWPGVALALTVIVFWLLLQFTRALRALRLAAGRPVGEVASAVMLHARLQRGMRLAQVLAITRSLGRRTGREGGGEGGSGSADEPQTFVWRDVGGDQVVVELRAGRVARWQLERGAEPAA